jgi:predicted dehydrogenase
MSLTGQQRRAAHAAISGDSSRPRLAVLGCGDVVTRYYAPALARLADRARVVVCCDPAIERARRVGELLSNDECPAIETTLEGMLERDDVDAVLDLAPAPLHSECNAAILAAGKHLYSEKPLAASAAVAGELIEAATAGGVLLMCAPALLATPRFRWLSDLLASDRLGSPTLACAHLADLGPAGWRAYAGDPTPFYGPAVGTLLDQGIYLLHGVTGLLGPASRLQAMGGIAMPERTVLGGPRTGERVQVGAPDHVLIQLQLESGVLAQVLSSFAVPATRTPLLEIHCQHGSVSFEHHLSASGPVNVYLRDETRLGCEGWIDGVPVDPTSTSGMMDVVGYGAAHFVECLRGEAEPLLDGRHAKHVLEIIEAAYTSIDTGESVTLPTQPEPFASPHRT